MKDWNLYVQNNLSEMKDKMIEIIINGEERKGMGDTSHKDDKTNQKEGKE